MNKSGSIFNSNHIVMYHYPTVTYSQLVAASVILPPRIPPRRGLGALRPQRSISILITFIIIYQKAASDIRSRTVSVLEADSGLRFIGPYSTARIFNRTSPSPFISFFNTINSLTLPLSRQKTARRDTSISSLFLKLL